MNYYIKNRLLYSLIFVVLISSLISIVFIRSSVNNHIEALESISDYKNRVIDFDVPRPSAQQIEQLEALGHIDAAIPYYFSQIALLHGNNEEVSVDIIMFESLTDMEQSMFNSTRFLDKSDLADSRSIFLDYKTAAELGYKAGDDVSISFLGQTINLKVGGILETTNYYSKPIVVGLYLEPFSTIVNDVRGSSIGYTGAFIVSNTTFTTISYLQQDYRPLGLLRSRDEFSSEESYQIHLNAILGSNYSSEITVFDDLQNRDVLESQRLSSSSILSSVLGGVVLFFSLLVFHFLMVNRESESSFFKSQLLSGKDIHPYYRIAAFGEAVVTFLVIFFSTLFYFSANQTYLTIGSYWLVLVILVIILMIESFVGYGFSLAYINGRLVKKAKSSNKQENSETDANADS